MQYTSDLYKPGAGRLGCPTILTKTSTNLIVLNPKEDPLAQAVITHNNLASHLYIISYLISTDFPQSLIL